MAQNISVEKAGEIGILDKVADIVRRICLLVHVPVLPIVVWVPVMMSSDSFWSYEDLVDIGHLSLDDGGMSKYTGSTYWAYIFHEGIY